MELYVLHALLCKAHIGAMGLVLVYQQPSVRKF